eukprot:TRINITY_DN338_c0_g1_i1.p1 TRINITY_DN338_c0_g1~~TRINITY_DN338_c0_g1_i1.p1  ORF type:complete len:498 (+),score=120.75 TRINITY_DN338_c0_g1_i1:425-1918(+)
MEILQRTSPTVPSRNQLSSSSYVCFASTPEPEGDPPPLSPQPSRFVDSGDSRNDSQGSESPYSPSRDVSSQQQQQQQQQQKQEQRPYLQKQPQQQQQQQQEEDQHDYQLRETHLALKADAITPDCARAIAKAVSLKCVVQPYPAPRQPGAFVGPVATQRAIGLTSQALRESKQLVNAIFEVCRKSDASFPPFLVEEDRSRLAFLKATLDLVVTYLSRHSTSVFVEPDFQALVTALVDRLHQIRHMLAKIYRRESAMTTNFDVFELTLRRALDQLQWLFPVGQLPSYKPESKIESCEAREAWIAAFGIGTYIVHFDSFVSQVIEKTPSYKRLTTEEMAKALLFLRYFIDFPSDDMITPYNWNQLVRLFGPYEHFVENFLSIALGGGFLGLINRIQAQEILLLNPSPRAVVIRFSRTQPNYLAFTYKDTTRCDGVPQIGNLLNSNPNTREVIPCSEFMRSQFLGFKLVPQRLNVGTIIGESSAASLVEYASRHNGYVVP